MQIKLRKDDDSKYKANQWDNMWCISLLENYPTNFIVAASSSHFPSDSQTAIPMLKTPSLAIKSIKNGKEIHFVLHMIHYTPAFSILYSISYNISFQRMRNLVLKRNIVFFRGKMTVSPNTLNNEIHTYFFAHYWQQQHTREQFQKHNESLERARQLKNNEKQEEEPKKEL